MHAILATIAAFAGEPQATAWPAGGNDCEPCLLDSIYSPLTAAAIFLVAVAKAGGPISDATANMIRDELKGLSGRRDVTELLIFSGWITEHERCPDMIAGKFGKLWRRALSKIADGLQAAG